MLIFLLIFMLKWTVVVRQRDHRKVSPGIVDELHSRLQHGSIIALRYGEIRRSNEFIAPAYTYL